MLGKWHLGTDPQGFDYWKVLPGQGDYYNPAFQGPKGREVIEGYCTDIVTDMALDWLKENVGGERPFMLMCQHKAPHRTWMPALRHLSLYDDVEIPEPATLFDDYCRQRQPRRVFMKWESTVHLNLVADCFGPKLANWNPTGKSMDRSGIRNKQKMTPEQLSTWDAAFEPKNNELRKLKLTGKELVRWEVSPVHPQLSALHQRCR